MPFGLRNAPATFSRLIQGLLYGMETFCVAYLDDILIFSETWSDHLKHLNLIRTSNLASTFTGLVRIKAHKKFWIKGSVGVSSGCPHCWVPPIISGTGKAKDFKFCRIIHIWWIGTKAHDKLWE